MKKMLSAKSFYIRASALACLLSLLLWGQGFGQDHAVSGTVTDKNGTPLQNVSVTVKGANSGTTTDANGRFIIHSVQAKPVLMLSLVGFGTQQVKASGGEINVSLEQAYNGLDTAIVSLGYSNQRRRDVSAAIGSVDGQEVKDLPATNVEEALQGRIAGVSVIKGSGAPGSSADILIRGYNSINNVAPLYIVDGVRSSGENFNMDDIASIDVLKDASAAAIYGSAAAGGVIIITTKKGGHSRPTVNFSARYGSVHPLIIKLLDRDQWIGLKRTIIPNFLSGTNVDSLPDVDWVNALYSNGRDEKYDLSVSGGNENANYLMSGFYAPQQGVFIDNSNYLSGFRINSDFRINKAIKIGEQLYATSVNNNPANSAANPPFRTVPTQLVYDPSNGIGGGWGKDPSYYEGGNAVANELTNPQLNRNYGVQGNVYALIRLPVYLSFKATVSYSTNYSMNESFQEAYNVGNVAVPSNHLQKSSSLNTGLLTNYVLSFDHVFGKHSINAFAGYEQQTGTSDGISLNYTAQGLSPTFSFIPTSASALQGTPSGTYDPNELIKSEFGQISYNYDGRYYIQGSVRRDGNFTVFGPDNRYGTFPSVSGGWRISEEKFFDQAATVVNELKLRGSYGEVGNSNIPAYSYSSSYSGQGQGNNFSPGGQTYFGLDLVGLSNADIKWESTHEVNVGLDAAFADKKLTLSMDWYTKKTENVLYNVPLPLSTGISTPYIVNIGSIQNRGYEFTLGYHDKAGSVGYSISFNGAFNKNKILTLDGTEIGEFPDGSTDIGGGEGITTGQNIALNVAGHSFGEFYGYKATGIYQNAQQIAQNPQFAGQTAMPGDLIFTDVNHSGALTDSDRTFIGNPNPKFVYGATINLNWNGFDASLLFNGVAGVDLYNGTKAYSEFLFQDGNTTSKVFGDSYLGSNGLTSQPRMGYFDNTNTFQFDPNGNYTRVNSYFVENGSYLKLKVLQLGYSFSNRTLQTAHINSARLYVEGTNVFTITKYTGQDPELSGGVTAHGIDAPNQYPHTRVYSVGLNLTF